MTGAGLPASMRGPWPRSRPRSTSPSSPHSKKRIPARSPGTPARCGYRSAPRPPVDPRTRRRRFRTGLGRARRSRSRPGHRTAASLRGGVAAGLPDSRPAPGRRRRVRRRRLRRGAEAQRLRQGRVPRSHAAGVPPGAAPQQMDPPALQGFALPGRSSQPGAGSVTGLPRSALPVPGAVREGGRDQAGTPGRANRVDGASP